MVKKGQFILFLKGDKDLLSQAGGVKMKLGCEPLSDGTAIIHWLKGKAFGQKLLLKP